MNCPNCGTAVPDGAVYCPGCASPVSAFGAGKSPNEVTREWVQDVLRKAGYDAKLSDTDANTVIAPHPNRINLVVTIRRNLGLITFQSWINMKKPGWGQDKALLVAVNEANASSWRNTYALDKEGDLSLSAYIFLARALSDQDITHFLENASDEFFAVVSASGLRNFVK